MKLKFRVLKISNNNFVFYVVQYHILWFWITIKLTNDSIGVNNGLNIRWKGVFNPLLGTLLSDENMAFDTKSFIERKIVIINEYSKCNSIVINNRYIELKIKK